MEQNEKQKNNEGKLLKWKKILLICVPCLIVVAAIIIILIAVSAVKECKSIYYDSNAFVSNWNDRSEESDLLTGGEKISNEKGDHFYFLPNGSELSYKVQTVWGYRYLSDITLEFSEEAQEDAYELSKQLLTVVQEIDDKESVYNNAVIKVGENEVSHFVLQARGSAEFWKAGTVGHNIGSEENLEDSILGTWVKATGVCYSFEADGHMSVYLVPDYDSSKGTTMDGKEVLSLVQEIERNSRIIRGGTWEYVGVEDGYSTYRIYYWSSNYVCAVKGEEMLMGLESGIGDISYLAKISE